MLLGVVVGLAIAIGLALLIVIYESAFPHTALLGRVGNTTIYRNVKQFPNSQVCDSHRIYLQIPSVLPHDPVLQHRLQFFTCHHLLEHCFAKAHKHLLCLQVLPGIAACRVDAPIYFANVQYIHERLRKYVARATAYSAAEGQQLQYLLLDMSPVTHLDSTGRDL